MTETPRPPESQGTPAGWYPDGSGQQRFWDGSAWTEHTQPSEGIATNDNATATSAATSTTTMPAASAGNDRPWFKKKRFIIPGVLIALLVIGSAIGGGGSSDDKPSSSAAAESSDATDTDVKSEAPKPEKTKAAPKLTSGQENALAAAENYLTVAPFSRKGLIRQLSSDAGDGYSKADATYAAEHVKVNYKEQAARAAKAYLEISPFSRSGMIEQLSSDAGDGYTRAEAEYGAEKADL